MTVSSLLNRTGITGNGSTTDIPVVFPFRFKDDLVVLSTVITTGVSTTQAHVTNYTITGTPDSLGHYVDGGTVVMNAAPASTVQITVYRDPVRTQTLDLTTGGSLPAVGLEAAFDYLTMQVQRLSDIVMRSLRQPDGDSANLAELPTKVDRASLFAAYDANGDPIAAAGGVSSLITTAFMATVLDDATAAAARTTLGVPAATAGSLISPALTTPLLTNPAIDGVISGTSLQIKRKTADESVTSSTTLQNDDHLVLAVLANQEWIITGALSVGATTSTTGFKFAVTVPSGATVLYTATISGNAAGQGIGGNSTSSGVAIDATTSTLSSSTNCNVTFHVWLITAATPGNVTIQWAQSSSSGSALTVRKGSMMTARLIA